MSLSVRRRDELISASIAGDVKRVKKVLKSLQGTSNVSLASLFEVSEGGETLMHIAADHGHYQLVDTLVEFGFSVDARDASGVAPIHRASERGHLRAMARLVHHHADLMARDRGGCSALHWAARNGHLEVCAYLLGLPSAKHPSLAPASPAMHVDECDNGGVTPLHLACFFQQDRVIALLLSAGADVHHMTQLHRSTPLHTASDAGHLSTVEILILAGADPNAADSLGFTPLHLACLRGHAQLARHLVRCGARQFERNLDGKTPGQLASAAFLAEVFGEERTPVSPPVQNCPSSTSAASASSTTSSVSDTGLGFRVSTDARGRPSADIDDIDEWCIVEPTTPSRVQSGPFGAAKIGKAPLARAVEQQKATQVGASKAAVGKAAAGKELKQSQPSGAERLVSFLQKLGLDRFPNDEKEKAKEKAKERRKKSNACVHPPPHTLSSSSSSATSSSSSTNYPSPASIPFSLSRPPATRVASASDGLVAAQSVSSTAATSPSRPSSHTSPPPFHPPMSSPSSPPTPLSAQPTASASASASATATASATLPLPVTAQSRSAPSTPMLYDPELAALASTLSEPYTSMDAAFCPPLDAHAGLPTSPSGAAPPLPLPLSAACGTAKRELLPLTPSPMQREPSKELLGENERRDVDRRLTRLLAELGLDHYIAVFVEEEWDWDALKLVSDGDLVKMGMKGGSRRKLLAAIERVKEVEKEREILMTAGKMLESYASGGSSAVTSPRTSQAVSGIDGTGDDLSAGGGFGRGLSGYSSLSSGSGATQTRSLEKIASLESLDLMGSAELMLQSLREWEAPYEELTLTHYIGKGFYGNVYRGRWRAKEVAIKKILRPVDMGKWLLEVQMLYSVSHSNVVTFYCACTTPPNYCIVTEFVARGSLRDVLTDAAIFPRLSLHTRLQMALECATGMEYLHGRDPPVIHRDLKTDNLLVTADWHVKVSDFGLSRFKDDTYSYLNPTSPFDVTITAPEVLEENRISEKADVFSFALLLLELHTATKPYPTQNPHWVAWSVMHNGLRPPVPGDVRAECKQLIEECWESDSGRRPPFSAIRARLRGILDALPQELCAPPPDVPVTSSAGIAATEQEEQEEQEEYGEEQEEEEEGIERDQAVEEDVQGGSVGMPERFHFSSASSSVSSSYVNL